MDLHGGNRMKKLEVQDLKILVIGAGVTGIAAVDALSGKVADLAIYDEGDDQKQREIRDRFPEIACYNQDNSPDLHGFTHVLKSPGISPDHPILERAEEAGLPIVSDIELSYRLFPHRMILGITGTNGKTTTTALLSHILSLTEKTVHCLGNIGVGALPAFFQGSDDDYYVIELSSFQLHNSPTLRARIAGVLNLSPDHINWHGSMDAYVSDKLRLVRNQTKDDVCVLNIDDPVLRKEMETAPGTVVPISLKETTSGFYLEEDHCMENGHVYFDFSQMLLPGLHNRQNALVAIAMAKALGVEDAIIHEGLRTFQGVAHRIEFVQEIGGIKFYNDSKGTNVDASIKAIEALPAPLRLLAGGMDKKISFVPLIKAAMGIVCKLYLYGETKYLIEQTAKECGFSEIEIFEDLPAAVIKAYRDSIPGDIVLLSPASASWDMYPNFETRGDHFKEIVAGLGGENVGE